MANISLEEAKALATQDIILKLRNVVIPKPTIDISAKVNNDILMSALCTAVINGVINQTSLNDKLIKLLNSATNTLSASKLGDILSNIRQTQPTMCCVITLKDIDGSIMEQWTFTGPEVYFNRIFEYVVDKFEITPIIIRNKMGEMLKTTIVNNIAQLLAKYKNLTTDEEKKMITISISTISRLVTMSGCVLSAEFKELI